MNEHGQVIYRFKQPFRDGTTQVVLDPLDCIARIEDPDVVATILEHIQARDEAEASRPRAPPQRTGHPDTSSQDRLF